MAVKYDYKVEQVSYEDLRTTLIALDTDGWELMTVESVKLWQDGARFVIISRKKL